MAPVVSVCIPTRNQAGYLAQAVESVLAQTFEDFEVVVYDDASTDETPTVLASLDDSRIRVYRQPLHVGVAANRNSCLGVSRGRYVAWLDSDDEWHPKLLARQVPMLQREAAVGLAHAAFEVVDATGRALPDWPPAYESDRLFGPVEAFDELIVENVIAAPTVVAPKVCYDAVGSFRCAFSASGEDWDMWLRLALHAGIAYTSETLARCRVHDESSTARSTAGLQRIWLDDRIVRLRLRDRRRHPGAGEAARRARAGLAARALLQAGDLYTRGASSSAVAAVGLAVRAEPRLGGNALRLVTALLTGSEMRVHRISRSLYSLLSERLVGTRLGARLENLARDDPAWAETLAHVAATVRRLTPPRAYVLAVDKWDPTLLHLSGRRGRHFPDRRLMAGYPPSSDDAIGHLEELRRAGAEYLVFPSAAFWWLDYYGDFREHLEKRYRMLWWDDACILYQLAR